MNRHVFFPALLALWAAASGLAAVAPSEEGLRFFEERIRPVLADHCSQCHSAKAEKVKAGLLLDTREDLLRGGDGGPAVVPGDPDQSRLIQAIRYTDDDLQMPPKQKLSPQQIADFEAWVRMGVPAPARSPAAADQKTYAADPRQLWAFQPIQDPPLPKVKDNKWPRQSLDHFILAELEDRKLKPAPPADKRTLIRRLSFDLTGLPPKPDEIAAFLADSSPEALARVVDRLLDSPHFGERWGRHWLDVARYADSNGLENNLPYPNAWRYRDYVIEAFNRDKPFDQFIREQLAGDLLPYPSDEERFEKLIATGFLVLGPKALFEPNQEKLRADVADEQIDVTTRAFLGLTVSCARCHDHKFDPIPTRDYYAMAGIFQSTASLTTESETRGGPGGRRWMERPLASREKAKQIEDHVNRLSQLTEQLRQARENPGGILSHKLPGIVVDNVTAEVMGVWKESIGLGNFVDKNYLGDGNADKGEKSARFVPKLPHTGDYEVLVSYTPHSSRATNVPVTIHSAAGVHTVYVNQRLAPKFEKAFVSVGTYQFHAGTNGAVVISNAGTKGFVTVDAVQFVPIDEWKLELAAMAEAERNTMASLGDPMTAPSNSGATVEPVPMAMAGSIGMGGPAYETLQIQISELRANVPPPADRAMAVQEGPVQNSRINLRGDPERLGEEVPRGFLTAVSRTKATLAKESSGRLELANWIASPENPLTARVAVNRIWLHLFGRGLVDTPDNFGALSEPPSHPDLLDHLARRFIAGGWSTKKLIREIVLSSSYQMSSQFDAKAYAKDPDNRYVWRMNRRRLEAEALRDGILALSGQLDLTRGGPSLSTNAPMEVPRIAIAQPPSNRRSVYLPVIRNDLPDFLQVFDFVDPHTISGKRHVTTAATQALFMMNSPFVQEQAKHWANALLEKISTDAERIETAYVQAFGRPPTRAQAERAMQFLRSMAGGGPLDPKPAEARRLFAWQVFCHTLLASTEFRFID